MNKKIVLLIAFLFLPVAAYSESFWGVELPNVNDTVVESEVTLDGEIYTYTYSIYSGSSNIGEIWSSALDIQQPRGGMELSSNGIVSGPHFAKRSAASFLSDPSVPKMVPVGVFAPDNWNSGLNIKGQASWGANEDQSMVYPGQSLAGFKITSHGLPGIREIRVDPELKLVFGDNFKNLEEIYAVEDKIAFKAKTIGPTAPPINFDGDFSPKSQLEIIYGYIDESQNLGWLNDTGLAGSLRTKLDSVGQAVNANDQAQAKTVLGEFMALLDSSSASQRTSEGYGLLYYNAKYLMDNMPENILDGFLFELITSETLLPLGSDVTLTARLTRNGRPVPNMYLDLLCKGSWGWYLCDNWNWTDENGRYVFNIPFNTWIVQGKPGTYSFKVYTAGTWFDIGGVLKKIYSDPVDVTWSVEKGGPDLVLESFFPPAIGIKGSEANYVTIKEITKNVGDVAAGPSVTRYYLSDDEVIDPATDSMVGERLIPALEPGESSDEGSISVTIAAGHKGGLYYLWACADAGAAMAETDEQNNCLTNQVTTQIVMLVESNQPPDCSQAFPGIASLWPPDHKTVKTGIVGVTDPDGDDIALQITGITQDEPVNGLGDGDTSPDGFGVGLSKAELRAERSGTGNGRLYEVHFAADDGKGGQCTGSVNVSVPRDKGINNAAINDGQEYDSTQR